MAAPPSHYGLVGPLFGELEQALIDLGASGHTIEERMRSIQGRLPSSAVRRLHYVRQERNALTHPPHRPLRDPTRWERECRHAIRDVRNLRPGRRRVVPRLQPRRASVAAASTYRRSPTPRDSRSGAWPWWAKAAAIGVVGYVVLTNETLTSMAALAVIGLVIWPFFNRS